MKRRKKLRQMPILPFVAMMAAAITMICILIMDEPAAEPETVEVEMIMLDTECSEVKTESIKAYKPLREIPLDADTQKYMQGVCEENNVSFAFALAVMESESHFDADATGDQGESVGYFQINKVNWPRMQELGYDVQDPKGNIAAGVTILRELFEKYDDPYMVIMGYKCGERRGRELFEQQKYKTKEYDCEALCSRATEIEGWLYE